MRSMMRRTLPLALTMTCAGGALLTGCGEATEEAAQAEPLVWVPDGKQDNFFSESAQEYRVTGTAEVVIEAEYAEADYETRLARARALVSYRQVVLAWFLNSWLVEKESSEESPYGGFKALTKNGSWQSLELREKDARTFEFDFTQELAGPFDLMSALPTEIDEDGRRYFDLVIGRISTEEMLKLELNNEWYRQAPWGSFKPDSVSADRLTTARMYIEPEPRSTDAWFDYNALIEDGVLDIDVHFGWDYHKAYHLVHSERIYERLVVEGFESPVGSYAEYNRTSGPLVRTVLTPKGPVEVQVRLFWGAPGAETDPDTDAGGRLLEEDMRGSFAERDVIVYSGHSGPFYGFALANWRKTSEGDLDDSEIAGMVMPERYQVVLAEGCDTYALGQAFFGNPAKAAGDNIDIITTTSFSNASTADTVLDFLRAFTKVTREGELAVPTLSTLLKDLDSNSWWFATMYGVHGIDDNPKGHPFGDAAMLCAACEVDADCGGPGNRCLDFGAGERACVYQCLADEGCPEGYTCSAARQGRWIRDHVCVPMDSCL